jgi:hypothetical protein
MLCSTNSRAFYSHVIDVRFINIVMGLVVLVWVEKCSATT